MSFVLFPHGGSGNHGCEAIVRSTIKILKERPILYSSSPSEDIYYGLDNCCTIRKDTKTFSRHNLIYWNCLIQRYVFQNKNAFDQALYRPLIKDIKQNDCLLSIGGDNYCYGYPKFITLANKAIRRKGIRTILWGCSIEPEIIHGELLEDLKSYSHIYARESLTYDALIAKGVSQTTLLPDPAFVLQSQEIFLPKGFSEGNIVGLNVSPMIISHEKEKGIILSNYEQLIQHIIEKTDMNIALIPHVIWKHNDDRLPLLSLFKKFNSSGRLFMVEDCNAEHLKGYISKCRFMVAARTHASIAAYSSKIPTIVLGYSVKAKGIAKDLFGTFENYVIPVQHLSKVNNLTEGFEWLSENEIKIKRHLNEFLPSYIDRIKNIKIV